MQLILDEIANSAFPQSFKCFTKLEWMSECFPIYHKTLFTEKTSVIIPLRPDLVHKHGHSNTVTAHQGKAAGHESLLVDKGV